MTTTSLRTYWPSVEELLLAVFAATDELSVPEVERAARRAQKHVEGTEADDLADAADALRMAFEEAAPGRIDRVPQDLADALVLVRDSARSA